MLNQLGYLHLIVLFMSESTFCNGLDVIYTINSPDYGVLERGIMPTQSIDLSIYGLYLKNKTSFSFKVKATRNIGVFATENLNSTKAGNCYMLFIGGHRNTWCDVADIRNGVSNELQREYDAYANASYFKPFWFSWKHGMLKAGHGEVVDQQTFITWDDPNPLDIYGIGIGTYWGATGEWKIKVEVEDQFSGHFSRCRMSNTRSDLPKIGNLSTLKVTCATECAMKDTCFGFNYESTERRCEILSFGVEPVTNILRLNHIGWNFYAKCYNGKKVCVGCFF